MPTIKINKTTFDNLLASLVVARDGLRLLVKDSPSARNVLWILDLKDALETAVSNLEALKDKFP